ncbi:restriction endonuclease subunit S [Aequorivita marina]|uniref:restriction endonuclease subunit S n=1 Tax=Aequorivita marina TaxID=3073654 RepID=UPI002875D9A1|nr:restriction endonuclease subunit S [Aequorivita sp. S2608]MDS1297081.1 restriction endonuclease subunit S [Aequorivita sp. S2608]
MKTYPAYKDSGVDWLGKIPEHWEAKTNKYIFEIKKNQVGKKSRDYDLLSLTLNGVILRDMENPEGKFPAEFNTYQEVKKDDFIFCLFDVEETPRTVGLSKFEGMITGAYTVMSVAEKNDSLFLYYYYLNLDSRKGLKFLYRGLRNTIPKDWFFSLKTPLPPKPEQQAIANYLDETCGKLDTVVAQKEKMIALLKERKQALIQNAVTRSLNENVPMKDSGVNWIGEIPENWEVKRLKFVSEIRNNKLYAKESELPYLGMENVESWSGKLKETESESEGLANVYKSGDVLFGKLRPYLAKVYLADHDGLCSSEFLPFISSDNLTNKFLKNIILSFRFINQIDSSTYGSKMPRANPDYIKNTLIPIPHKEEQEKIVNYIDAQSQKIDQAVKQQEQAIIKLKEYKASLIDSCVLGKIKVS